MWTKWGEPFNKNYSIRDRDYWNHYWDNCTLTAKQVYVALRNVHYACNHEYQYLESRYISPDPCQFIKGMFHRILNDNEISFWFDADHPDWENPESKNYDKNMRLFKD